MTALAIRPLSDDLPFGARIAGVNWDTVKNEAVRLQIRDVFEDRGMIVFEDMEASNTMQIELSSVFGPPQVYAIEGVPQLEDEGVPGIVDFGSPTGETTVFDFGGELRAGWVNWHFDACYTAKLNRGGVLRLTTITPELGLTGFADGVQIWNALSPEWRERAEGLEVVYHEGLMFERQRFGMEDNWKLISLQTIVHKLYKDAEAKPRSVHPAVWQRASGEKVMHIAPWQAACIEGREDAEGDALLAALWREVKAAMVPYWHGWKPSDMVIWDNWRFLHSVSGHDPKYARNARRTTIAGDYGLGRFEGAASVAA